MNIMENVAQIKSQLEQIDAQEKANQQEQEIVNRRIIELESELQQQHKRRSELDDEALQLYTQAEELRPKLDKLTRIANLSQEFLELHAECQDNQDLLNTLYSSVSNISIENKGQNFSHPLILDLNQPEPEPELESPEDNHNSYANYSITIDEIKEALPNAEKVYQQLVAGYLEEYKTYQNYIVDGLDLIWYAVAFIAFGRSSYRKMSFKYHPDLDGSERAMQLVNTAWSISQNFLGDLTTPSDTMNTL
ncbi:J domain-containing protein [Pleurocapsa sp. PCC 7319]|uniref:J domain-containing protein n=1 Tax=Pleurocapsa sp. PCC 7319 TaxID=118161 RepID=UPI001ED9C085|nr:J domain-containing protein [Pleurocapsa sp. PCC 7319]